MFALRKGDILSYTRAFDSTSNILIFLLSIIASQSIGLVRMNIFLFKRMKIILTIK